MSRRATGWLMPDDATVRRVSGRFAPPGNLPVVSILPMFPLGSVLFPGTAVPLRIFEERYQRLLADVLAADGTFGTVLIERGHEVGGDDDRFGVGTVAHIEQHEAVGDGRHQILALGVHRIRIDEWLDDAPYPRARVTLWPDDPDDDPTATRARYRSATTRLRRFLGLAAELGHRVPDATFDVPSDPSIGSHRLCALAPVGSLDRQRLLEEPDAARRLQHLETLIDDQLALIPID